MTGSPRGKAALVGLLFLAGCATGPGGERIEAPAPRAAGSVLTYEVRNAYNGARIGESVLRFGAGGARLEGIGYQEPPAIGFSATAAPIAAREFNPAGELVLVERSDGSVTRFEPPLRVLPFPLVPGTRFRQTVTATASGEAPRRVLVTGVVAGWETLTLPGGAVRALRVERDVFMGDATFHRTETARREIDWYAPSLGVVVRSSEDSQFDDFFLGGGDEGGQPPARRGDWIIREATGALAR